MKVFKDMKIQVLLTIIFISSAACSTVKIESNRDPNYREKFDNIYVYIKASPRSESFLSTNFDQFFIEALKRDSIRIMFYSTKKLDLETESPEKKAVENNFTILLSIIQVESTTFYNTGGLYGNGVNLATVPYVASLFEASIYDLRTNKRIWRANIDVGGDQFYAKSARVEKLANELVAQLRRDWFIKSKSKQN